MLFLSMIFKYAASVKGAMKPPLYYERLTVCCFVLMLAQQRRKFISYAFRYNYRCVYVLCNFVLNKYFCRFMM